MIILDEDGLETETVPAVPIFRWYPFRLRFLAVTDNAVTTSVSFSSEASPPDWEIVSFE